MKHFQQTAVCFVLAECQPVQFWILSRHGTRYTDSDGIDEMWSLRSLRDEIINNFEKGRK
jgi:hypothetical protein